MFHPYLTHLPTIPYVYFIAIAEVYKNEGNDEYRKKDFGNAVYFYTEGIKVKCKDEELNAKLYSNRAIAYFYMGEHPFCFLIFYLLNVEPSELSFRVKILGKLDLMQITSSYILFSF